MYIEHRSDRVTTQYAAFHGASANPASRPTTFFKRRRVALLYLPFFGSHRKKCTTQKARYLYLLPNKKKQMNLHLQTDVKPFADIKSVPFHLS
jgi:hypothetical protein